MAKPRLIPVLLVFLPVGLIIGGVIAHLYWKHEREQKFVTPNAAFASSLREPVTEKALRGHVEALATTIGVRTPDTGLARAADYIESTIGPANSGYAVERTLFFHDDKEWPVLEIALPSKSRNKETILVATSYDTPGNSRGANTSASCVAVTLSVAKALTGTTQERVIRFVFLPSHGDATKALMPNAAAFHAKRCFDRGDRLVAVICLSSLGAHLETPNSQAPAVGITPPFPNQGNFLALITAEKGTAFLPVLQKSLENNKNLLVESRVSVPASPLWQTSLGAAYGARGYPSLLLTDTGPLRQPSTGTPSDTSETLNYPVLTKIAQALESALVSLANPSGR